MRASEMIQARPRGFRSPSVHFCISGAPKPRSCRTATERGQETMSTTTQMKHTQEPWYKHTFTIRGLIGSDIIRVALIEEDYDRAQKCVHACAGIQDPEKTIPQMREALRVAAFRIEELQLRHGDTEMSESPSSFNALVATKAALAAAVPI